MIELIQDLTLDDGFRQVLVVRMDEAIPGDALRTMKNFIKISKMEEDYEDYEAYEDDEGEGGSNKGRNEGNNKGNSEIRIHAVKPNDYMLSEADRDILIKMVADYKASKNRKGSGNG